MVTVLAALALAARVQFSSSTVAGTILLIKGNSVQQLQEQGIGDIFRMLTWQARNLSENYCNYGHDRAVRVKGMHILSEH